MGDSPGFVGPTFGLQSSADMYEKLQFEAQRLRNGWGKFDAANFIWTAWHLFNDWPKSEPHGTPSRAKRDRSSLPEEMRLVIGVANDLANGSKHFILRGQSADRCKVEDVHDGAEASWWAFFFQEDLPGVTTYEGWYFSIRLLHNILSHYFVWVFDDNASVDCFPDDLLEAIRYCHVPTRRSGPSPRIWLEHIEDAYSNPAAKDEA